LISGAIFLPVLVYRISVEEVALKSCFGEQCVRHMERIKRVIRSSSERGRPWRSPEGVLWH
jgi:hypothetical protein